LGQQIFMSSDKHSFWHLGQQIFMSSDEHCFWHLGQQIFMISVWSPLVLWPPKLSAAYQKNIKIYINKDLFLIIRIALLDFAESEWTGFGFCWQKLNKM
jgi:hypothetical protein